MERQPPQVLKTQTKFVATGRVLAGGKVGLLAQLPEARAVLLKCVSTNQGVLAFGGGGAAANSVAVVQSVSRHKGTRARAHERPGLAIASTCANAGRAAGSSVGGPPESNKRAR